jgi:hypothetical protein
MNPGIPILYDNRISVMVHFKLVIYPKKHLNQGGAKENETGFALSQNAGTGGN